MKLRAGRYVGLILVGLLASCVGEDLYVPGQSDDAGTNDGASTNIDASSESDGGRTPSLTLHALNAVEVARNNRVVVTVRQTWSEPRVATQLTYEAPAGLQIVGPSEAPPESELSFSLQAAPDALMGDTQIRITTSEGATLSLPVLVRGAPGELDTTFGTNGRAALPTGEPYAMALQPRGDDGFVVAGMSLANELILADYEGSGALNASFAAAGLARGLAPSNTTVGSFFNPLALEVSEATYQLAYGFNRDANATFPLRLVAQRTNGSISYLPNAPVATSLPGTGVPDDNGLFWLGEQGRVVQLFKADGQLASTWGNAGSAAVFPAALSAQYFSAEFQAVSADRLLIANRGTQPNGSKVWSGLAVVSRASGTSALMEHPAGVTRHLASVALVDGSFLLVYDHPDHRKFYKVTTNITPVSTDLGIPHEFGSGTSAQFLRGTDQSLYLVAFDGKIGHGRAVHFDNDIRAIGNPIPFTLPTLVNDVEGPFAAGGFIDSHNRLVVLLQYDDDASDPSWPNLHWLVQRYWL